MTGKQLKDSDNLNHEAFGSMGSRCTPLQIEIWGTSTGYEIDAGLPLEGKNWGKSRLDKDGRRSV